MPWLAVAWVLGVSGFQCLPVLPALSAILGIAVIILVSGWLRAWLLCAFFLGWLWAGLFATIQLSNLSLAATLIDQDLAIQGEIVSLVQHDSRKARFDFKVLAAPSGVPNKLKLSWYQPEPKLRAGQRWSLVVKLKPPHSLFNPGGFDYTRWLFTQGIGATGYVRQVQQARLLSQASAWQNIQILRQSIAERINQLGTLRYLALIKALSIGDTDDITPTQWRVLQQSGTLHLIAISGSHLSLIAGCMYWLTSRLWLKTGILSYAPPQIGALSASIAALGYAALAGFAIPTQRALLMLCIVMFGRLWQRYIRSNQILALALLLITLYDPLAVLSPGFWLSFLAVAVIFLSLFGRLRPLSYWQSMIKTHGLITLGLMPILLYCFQQISLISPVANVIAAPMIGFLVVPLCLLGVICLALAPQLAAILLHSADQCLTWLWPLLEYLASWPLATVKLHGTGLTLCLAAIGVCVLVMPKGLPGRWLGWVLCLPLWFNQPKSLDVGQFKLTLLDVGQGLATVVQTAQHVLVFDTGIKFSEYSDSGQRVLLPFLTQQGINKLNGIIISHGDNDHIGGVQSLLAEYSPQWLYTSVPEKLLNYQAQRCVQGQHWTWDEVEFTIVSPPTEKLGTENDNSCVLHIRATNASALLTGDIERSAEMQLVSTYKQKLAATLLIAPHHGSNTSSSLEFLRAVQPQTVFIPAGWRNPFHFPHREVLQRYQQQGIVWLNTAEQGALQAQSTTHGLQLTPFRPDAVKYWHQLALR